MAGESVSMFNSWDCGPPVTPLKIPSEDTAATVAEHEGLGPAELTLSTGPLTPPPGCCRHPEPELLGPKAAPRSLLFLYFFFFSCV